MTGISVTTELTTTPMTTRPARAQARALLGCHVMKAPPVTQSAASGDVE
jgi:hypothetical protein